jgi:hypothetical protein
MLLNEGEAAAFFGVGRRKFQDMRRQPWFTAVCTAVELGPRALRWHRDELMAAAKNAPRVTKLAEPPGWPRRAPRRPWHERTAHQGESPGAVQGAEGFAESNQHNTTLRNGGDVDKRTAPMAPPYPAETRAKGWRFELDYERIEQSDTWSLAGSLVFDGMPLARPLLLAMWYASWKQTPCGSLPAEDKLIAAAVGVPAAIFAEYRDVLLRGWWLADDGRLYHYTLTDRVLEMVDSRSSNAKRVADFKAKKREQHAGNALPARDSPMNNDNRNQYQYQSFSPFGREERAPARGYERSARLGADAGMGRVCCPPQGHARRAIYRRGAGRRAARTRAAARRRPRAGRLADDGSGTWLAHGVRADARLPPYAFVCRRNPMAAITARAHCRNDRRTR